MKKSILIVQLVILLFFVLSFGCLAQDKKGSKINLDPSIENNPHPYIIDSGDILEIMTWKEPDLTQNEVLVRTDGKISFPFLDDLQASGLTPFQLKQKIETGLKKYVEYPYVTVQVKKPDSKKIYILGEVLNTGEYPLVKRLTVLQAFALAGGFTEWASKKEIILLRHEDGTENIYRVNYRRIVDGKDLSQNLELRPNDTIIVP
jgi:polysaccharide biosynthesis/export protein